jgi:hypothetical protein
MKKRKLRKGNRDVSAVGFGCMGTRFCNRELLPASAHAGIGKLSSVRRAFREHPRKAVLGAIAMFSTAFPARRSIWKGCRNRASQ